MANPFLEDFIQELEQEELRKTTTEPEVSQNEKNLAWDIIGSTAWSFADEFGFGLPGLAARKMGYEEEVEELMPESLAAKIGSGFGALGGFATGLPYRTGLALGRVLSRPFIKRAGLDAGEYALNQTAKQVSKTAYKKATTAGLDKEIAAS